MKKPKRPYEIQFVQEGNRKFLQTFVNGRGYRADFNPYMNPNEQCNNFIQSIVENEDRILMEESVDVYDYMFKKMIVNNEE